MDRQLEAGQEAVAGTGGGLAAGSARVGWPRGRRPAPAPDGSSFPAKLTALVRQRFSYLNGRFNALVDKRRPDDCLYSAAAILWMVVLGFLCRKGSRNAMDVARNTGFAPANLLALSGQRQWPKGRPLSVPCTETANRFLEILDPRCLEEILVAIIRTLLHAKIFDAAKIDNWTLMLVDGTKQENFRRWYRPWRRKYRYVLHVKVLGPDDTAFTALTEPCDHYDTEKEKLDCEREAFKRVAVRLKAAFPRLAICLVGDALFACEAAYEICERNGWKFIFTFKEGSYRAVFGEAMELLALVPGNIDRFENKEKAFTQDTRWVGHVAFGDRCLSVVLQGEINATRTYFCSWVTNWPIHSPERARAIAAAGRSRSRIEESYNVQKNGGFGLEHAFRETDQGAANYHLLMQLAHTLWQLLSKGWIRRELAACRKLTDISLAELLAQALRERPPPEGPLPAFQLRFADG